MKNQAVNISVFKLFLSHLSGDEADIARSLQADKFLSHLSGDEEILITIINILLFLSHLSGDEDAF